MLKSYQIYRFLLHAVFLGLFFGALTALITNDFRDFSFLGSLKLSAISVAFIPIWMLLAIFAASSKGNIVYWSLFVIALIFSIYVTLAAFMPGAYATDQIEELHQAVTGEYHDYQPPLMAWVWSILLRITGRPESLLVFHLCLLTAAAVCWARVFQRLRALPAMLTIPILILSPAIVNLSGFMAIDVGFAYTMLLTSGIASLILIDRQIRIYQLLIVMIIGIYSIGVRWNGILSVLPILGVVTWQTVSTFQLGIFQKRPLLASILIPICYIAIVTLGLNYLYYDILKTRKSYIFQIPQLFDIAGISIRSGKDYFPDYIKNQPTYNMAAISAKYTSSCNPLFWPPTIPQTSNRKKRSEVTKSWIKAIYKEPGAYLQHRLFIFSDLMKGSCFLYMGPPDVQSIYSMCKQYEPSDLTKVIQYRSVPGFQIARNWVSNIQNGWKETVFCKGWFWIVLLFMEFIVGLLTYKKLPSGQIVLLLSTAALLYVLPQIIVIGSPEIRYLYWSNIAACFAVVVFFTEAINLMINKIFERAPHL